MSTTRYARAIERCWCRLLDEPVLLSPRDWRRIDRWYALRVPLELVEEAMTEAVERDRARGRTSRLSDLARSVEQAWAVVREGRTADEVTATPAAERPWRACLAELDAASPLAGLLEELLSRWESGEPAAAIDSELDRRLCESVDSSLVDTIDREVRRELEPHRGRMSAERYETTHRGARTERLRRRLGLARLAEHDVGD